MEPTECSQSMTYESFVSKYTSLIHAHDSAVAASLAAQIAYQNADNREISLLKRSISCYSALIARSTSYRSHCSHVKSLSRRLLTWNHDLRRNEAACDVDEVELLRYGTCVFAFMHACDLMVRMNHQGVATRKRSDALYEKVQRTKEWKVECDKEGQLAFEERDVLYNQLKGFQRRLKNFAAGVDKTERNEEKLGRMDQWMDELTDRLKKGVTVQWEWAKVLHGGEVFDEGAKDEQDRVKKAYGQRKGVMEHLEELLEKTRGYGECPCCESSWPGHEGRKDMPALETNFMGKFNSELTKLVKECGEGLSKILY